MAHTTTPHSSSSVWARLLGRLRSWARRTPEEQPLRTGPACIQVWDADRDFYRSVSLDNRNDPLWPAACELACLERDIRHAA